MKRYMMTLMMAMTAWMGANAMDYETAREQAYYLTDKMAYELNLNDQQYNDAYEINLDYLLSINTEADLYDDRYLSYRNDDLRHILYNWQWTAFAASHYLFRPLLWRSGVWYFPVYDYYARTLFYYHRPSIFWNYRGGHGRYYYSYGYYANRRPHWDGGLRGRHHTMIGRPHNNSHHGGMVEHRGGHGMGHNNHRDIGRSHSDIGRSHNDIGRSHSSIGHDNSNRSFSGTSRGGSNFGGGSSRGGSSFSGSTRGGSSHSFSGGSRGGGGFSGGSRGGGGFGGSTRGGGSSRGGRR